MNQDQIVFYELTQEQLAELQTFCSTNGYDMPTFTPYDGKYYYRAQGDSVDFLMVEWDWDDGIEEDDYTMAFWTKSTVPSVLWP